MSCNTDMKITPRVHGTSPLLMLLMFLLGLMGTPAWAVEDTASDTFPSIAYNGSDGTLPWASDWQEFGENNGPTKGRVRVRPNRTTAGVTNCVATNCLRIGGNQVEIQNKGVVRQIDLSGATSATLSFTYRRQRPGSNLTTGLGLVRAEVSSDGGATWETLASYPFTTTNDPSRTTDSFDITSAASANTRIRFIGDATDDRPYDSVGFFHVDDVKVDVVKPDSDPDDPPPPPSAGLSVSDSFAARAFNGSDGVAPNTDPGPWIDPWIEKGEGNGPTKGRVRVVTNNYCAATSCLRIGGNEVNIDNRGVSRAVDLSGAVTAQLVFDYRRLINSAPAGSGGVLVQVSPDGSGWTTLDTLSFPATSDLSEKNAYYDIPSSAIAAGTQIQFLGQGTNAQGMLHVDNVKVQWTTNYPPSANEDSYTTPQGTALNIAAPGVLANDTDPEGGALTAAVATNPAQGSLTLNLDGSFIYTPQPLYNGPDSFNYVANDGASDSPTATVAITVTPPANQPPAFNPTSYNFTVSQSAPTGTEVGTLSATDPEGGAITYAITADSSGGAFTLSSPTLTVANPALLTSGTYTVTVSATDTGGLSAQPPATISVTVVNEPPVFGAASYSFTVNQTAATGTAVGSVSATDPDDGAVTYTITADNRGNAFAIDPSTGSITVAAALTAGTLNLTVRATDPSGAYAQVPVTVTVAEVSLDLRLLIIGTGPAANDPLNKAGPDSTDSVLGYIQRFLEQAGVPYDVLDASEAGRAPLTSADLLVSASHGRYNGIILTDTILGWHFASSEWAVLHSYEREFKVREAVLSGFPTYSWNWPTNCYAPDFLDCDYDYGMVNGSWANNVDPADPTTTLPIQGQWNSDEPQFAYVNKSNPLTITDFAWYATPRNDATVMATPLLTDQDTGKALISRLTYADGREVLLSSIGNAWFLLHSEVLAREFVSFATKGVFIGGSMAYLNIHVDDLFLGDDLWDPVDNWTSVEAFARLDGSEVPNVVAEQNNFRAEHPLADEVKLEFALNGAATGVDTGNAACTALANQYLTGDPETPPDPISDPLVLTDSMDEIQASQDDFGFINHSYTHLDLDFSGNQLAAGEGPGTSMQTDYQNQINCNRLVWQSLGLPGYQESYNTMVTGEHSGIKDDGYHNEATGLYCYADSDSGSHCVDEAVAPFPEPPLNVLLNDPAYAFPYAGNPQFFETAQNDLGLRYLASDASQVNQDVEQFVTDVPSNRYLGDIPTEDFNLVLLPRYPTNVFYNVSYPGALLDCSTQPNPPTDPNCQPGSLVDEYNNLFRERPLALNGGEYCIDGIAQPPYQGSICETRDYGQILDAEALTAVRHLLGWQMYPHFFHEVNLKDYDGAGSTLLFDWANSVMTLYEEYMNLPVKSLPYWKVGQLTEERLNALDAEITGVWNVSTGTVSLQATTLPPGTTAAKAMVTGVAGSEPLYGGQSIQTIEVGTNPVTVPVSLP